MYIGAWQTQDVFEDTKGVIRIRISNDRQDARKKKDERTKNDLQTSHRKLKIEQHEANLKLRVNLGAPEGLVVHDSYVTPIVLLLNDRNNIWYVNHVRHQLMYRHTNNINKTKGVETNEKLFLRGHHHTELKTWRHVK